jgi:hypothetical protein
MSQYCTRYCSISWHQAASLAADCIPGSRLHPRQQTASQAADCIPGSRLNPRQQTASQAADCIPGSRLHPRQQTASQAANCIPGSRLEEKTASQAADWWHKTESKQQTASQTADWRQKTASQAADWRLHPKQQTASQAADWGQKTASQNRRVNPRTDYCVPSTRNHPRQDIAFQAEDNILGRVQCASQAEDYILSSRLNPRQKTASWAADCIPAAAADCVPLSNRLQQQASSQVVDCIPGRKKLHPRQKTASQQQQQTVYRQITDCNSRLHLR